MSGYDLRKFVKENLGFFWKESYGQIYPMLKRMAAHGLVEARTERGNGKPDRQVYSLNPAGHAELQAWLSRPAVPASPRNELLLKLFFGRRGNAEEMIRHVEEFRRRHEGWLQQYARVEKWLNEVHANHADLPFWLITLEYGKRNSRALLDWSDTTVRTLRSLAKSPQDRNQGSERKQKGGKKS